LEEIFAQDNPNDDINDSSRKSQLMDILTGKNKHTAIEFGTLLRKSDASCTTPKGNVTRGSKPLIEDKSKNNYGAPSQTATLLSPPKKY